MKIILTIALFITSFISFGQQLSYTPKNPSFGGNTFNYQWLLSSAEAQNSFTDPTSRDDGSGIDQFSENLNRQLLGQLSRSLLGDQLENGLEEGNFVFGDLSVEITESSEGLVVNILDLNSGEQTQIIIPN
jgi:curli production assembly/transport component CsgF|tara:strand:- start:90 stop:482 length:393 start_codon:yes stop_codon:yes gene_type:complete